jgi:hypothetical protein
MNINDDMRKRTVNVILYGIRIGTLRAGKATYEPFAPDMMD